MPWDLLECKIQAQVSRPSSKFLLLTWRGVVSMHFFTHNTRWLGRWASFSQRNLRKTWKSQMMAYYLYLRMFPFAPGHRGRFCRGPWLSSMVAEPQSGIDSFKLTGCQTGIGFKKQYKICYANCTWILSCPWGQTCQGPGILELDKGMDRPWLLIVRPKQIHFSFPNWWDMAKATRLEHRQITPAILPPCQVNCSCRPLFDAEQKRGEKWFRIFSNLLGRGISLSHLKGIKNSRNLGLFLKFFQTCPIYHLSWNCSYDVL